MRHRRKPPGAAASLALMVALLPIEAAWAQAASWYQGANVHPGFWSGSLGLTYLNGAQSSVSTDPGASTTTSNKSSALGESLKIANTGFYVISPRLFTGNLALDLQFNQSRYGGAGSATALQGKAIGYNFDGTFLASQPYSASVFANRGQSQQLQASGGQIVGVRANRGLGLYLSEHSALQDMGYPWAKADLQIREESSHIVSTSFGRSLTSDEQNRTLAFNASKGFETADLGLRYQLNDKRNAAFSQGNFRSMATGLVYSLDFGPTLNRRFDSQLSYTTRDGAAPSTLLSNSEHLRIDHDRSLSTDYRYGFNRLTLSGIRSTVHNGTFALSHQLYKNLTTTLSATGSRSTLPTGASTTYGGQLGQNYRHSLPGKGNLSLNWSGGYQLSSNQLSSSNVAVVDEAHKAQSLILRTGFLLDHNFVVTGSIVVTNSSRRPLSDAATAPPGTGDFEVVKEGNQIRIVPLPTSLLLSEGDTLLVSYSYLVDANLTSNTKSSGFGMGVDYGWMTASLGHRKSKQTALNQTSSQFLQNTQQNFLRLGLRGNLMTMPTHADLDFESRHATNSASNAGNFGAGLVWEREWLRLRLDVKVGNTKYTLPDQHTTALRSATSSVEWSRMSMITSVTASDSQYTWPAQRRDSLLAAQTSLNWYTESGWTHSATLDWTRRQQSGYPTETLVQALAKSRITMGKLSLDASLGLGQWTRAGSRSNNRSFNFSAVRQF